MSSPEVNRWLRAKRWQLVVGLSVYAVLAVVGGTITLLPVFFMIYVFAQIALLLTLPHLQPNRAIFLCSGVSGLGIGLIWRDCLHAERDDMSFLPRWLVREFVHAGPRLIMDGWRNGVRAAQLLRLDINTCGNVLAFLAGRDSSASRAELVSEFPELDWTRLIAQLRLLDGILFLRPDVSRLSLTSILRMELRQFAVYHEPSGTPANEELPPAVTQPEQLSPWEILGVSDGATSAEVKAAYRRRIKECHPDHFAGMDEKVRQVAEEWTKALNLAYDSLAAPKQSES